MRITVEPPLQALAELILVECDICGDRTLNRFWPVTSLDSRVVEQTVRTVENKSLLDKLLLEEEISDKVSYIIAFHTLVIVGAVGRARVKSCSGTVKLNFLIGNIIFFFSSVYMFCLYCSYIGNLSFYKHSVLNLHTYLSAQR